MSSQTEKNNSSSCESAKQTIVVTLYLLFLLTGSILGWVIWFLLIWYFPLLRLPLLLYAAWIYYDRGSIVTGNRRSERLRRWKIWKYHNEYFPAKLIKTVDLPADKNYIFATFPHGILASGAYSAFGNVYGRFEEIFPGLKSWILTLEQHFHTPFLREYVLTVGALPASAICMSRMLGSEQKGTALVLIVGGAQEAFYSEPGKYTVNLKSRKGFIRIALRNGASIVPVISFGEPDIYQQIRFDENSLAYKIQLFIKRVTHIAPVAFYGRCSITPFRKPINTVVGEPMHLEKIEKPTQEQVDDVHANFVRKLIDLFEKEKKKYLDNPENVQLTVV